MLRFAILVVFFVPLCFFFIVILFIVVCRLLYHKAVVLVAALSISALFSFERVITPDAPARSSDDRLVLFFLALAVGSVSTFDFEQGGFHRRSYRDQLVSSRRRS